MASITIPTPIETTCTTIGNYIVNENTTDLQSLLGDTDFTISEHCLKYKNLPILTNSYTGSEYSKYLLYATDRGRGVNNSTVGRATNYFGDSRSIYFYNFDTFIVIVVNATIESIRTGTVGNIVVIDKTNVECFDAFNNFYRFNNSCGGLFGIMFNYLDSNSSPVMTKSFPIDFGDATPMYRNCNIRRASTTKCTYTMVNGYDGKQATRVAFFSKYPAGSSNSVLHVGNKYFYILPIDETVINFTRYDYDGSASYTESQEAFCTLGIDVTSEVS